jgi:hypothetical protein
MLNFSLHQLLIPPQMTLLQTPFLHLLHPPVQRLKLLTIASRNLVKIIHQPRLIRIVYLLIPDNHLLVLLDPLTEIRVGMDHVLDWVVGGRGVSHRVRG